MYEIKDNIDSAQSMLSDLGRRQLPFAVAQSLNDTALDAKAAEEKEMDRALDAPTPFTKRGLFVARASKRKPEAVVGFKDVQADYLRLQVAGGVRRPKRSALVVPVRQRVNRYGNLPKGAVRRVTAKKNVFVTRRGSAKSTHLAPGIYKRASKTVAKRGAGPQLLIAFEPKATYRRRLDFGSVIERSVRSTYPDHFYRRLRRAIETAR